MSAVITRRKGETNANVQRETANLLLVCRSRNPRYRPDSACPGYTSRSRPGSAPGTVENSAGPKALDRMLHGAVLYQSAKRGLHPVAKIILESILVFAVCLMIYVILRQL